MPLLIDGYNLLHVSGVFGTGTALTELHRSREALLAFLAAALAPAERAQTTIVFDAASAPPGLPQSFLHDGVRVEFAREPGNADAMLEKLIAAHDAPRKLIVVSGDHRVQRAARRRRAQAIDSDRWWAELCASDIVSSPTGPHRRRSRAGHPARARSNTGLGSLAIRRRRVAADGKRRPRVTGWRIRFRRGMGRMCWTRRRGIDDGLRTNGRRAFDLARRGAVLDLGVVADAANFPRVGLAAAA